MSERRSVTTFYRIASDFPPPDKDYLTARQKGRKPPANASARLVRSYDGLSASDVPEWCVAVAKRIRGLGDRVVRYHVPPDAKITWEPHDDDPHHFDLYGDPEELKGYLDPDYQLPVPRRSP